MDREKIPRTIAGTGTFVTDPEDEVQAPEAECPRPCCREDLDSSPGYWGWRRVD